MYGRSSPEPEEPERVPENWSAHLLVAAKGGGVTIAAEWDEFGDMTSEPEPLAGLALAKRCREEGADLRYTGAAPAASDDDAEGAAADGAEGALTALECATSLKIMDVLPFLANWDATERLIGACRDGDLGAAQKARLDGVSTQAVCV